MSILKSVGMQFPIRVTNSCHESRSHIRIEGIPALGVVVVTVWVVGTVLATMLVVVEWIEVCIWMTAMGVLVEWCHLGWW